MQRALPTKPVADIVLSVLDLAGVREGGSVAESFANTVKLAQAAEQWGYRRFWLAEHHNMPGIASAATSVLIGHVAANTKTIRVGSGGVMLPNHAPLMIAEQFGTLEALYPGRIDLGLGRAVGGDAFTAQAIGRGPNAGDHFPELLQELMHYLGRFPPGKKSRPCRAAIAKSRSGCSAPALSARSLRPRWECPSPLPASSRRR